MLCRAGLGRRMLRHELGRDAHADGWSCRPNINSEFLDGDKKEMSYRKSSGTNIRVTLALGLFVTGLLGWLTLPAGVRNAVEPEASAAITITVTTAADNGDNANPTAGSLRAAIITSNTTPGTDTINFQIGTGIQTIKPTAALPIITDPVIIDGTTQPGFNGTPIIELNGTSAGANANGLQATAGGGGTTIKGLVINRFAIGIDMSGNGNTIKGNYIGTDVTGTIPMGNTNWGVNLTGNNLTIGGTTTAERNIISASGNTGLRMGSVSNCSVLGNYIGTDVTGTQDLGNGNQGMRIDNGSNNKIGGSATGEGNLISGNGDSAVQIIGGLGTKVIGNRFGTDVTGLRNIGNDAAGVAVYSGTGNLISSNTIAFNSALGIELDENGSAPPDGITANDLNDADAGANNLQNYPVITSVTPQAGSTNIQGTLNSTTNTQFHLEFFASVQCDPSGNGEGQTYLGAADVTTVGNDANFNVTLPVPLQPNQFVTANATDPNGNTSEFAKCAAGGAPVLRFSANSYFVTESQATADVIVNRTGDPNIAVSVDYATSDSAGLTPCQIHLNINNGASERCDYATTVGTLRFAAGETTKTIQIPIINDAYIDPNETFTIRLSAPQGASLGSFITARINFTDDDTQAAIQNPIDNQAFFIRQQYIDFLGRVAEPAGFNFWNNRMTNCPPGQICDRTDTSQRFFQSDEFQARGFYVYRLFDEVLGRLPRYTEFVFDTARLNGYQTVQEQQQARDAYLSDFINRDEFKALYGQYLSANLQTATDAAGFVNALSAKAGITPAAKQTLIDNLQNHVKDPAHTVEDFIQTPEMSGVGSKFYDRGFIAMQYFSYLHRDPDTAGLAFWYSQLIGANAPHKQDYRFMVGGFINSDEYRFRFALISTP
jgi:hypothetical protein